MEIKKPVIVVEGKTDIEKVKKVVDAIFVSTNGSEVPRETLEYIKTLSQTRQVIILTDPDYPGLRIRELVSSYVPCCYHAYVDRKKASNGKKLGVAESPLDEIKKALKDAKCYEGKEEIYRYNLSDFYQLGLSGKANSSFLREKVYEHYSLGYGNAKTLMNRLSIINVSKDELKEYISEVTNENSK